MTCKCPANIPFLQTIQSQHLQQHFFDMHIIWFVEGITQNNEGKSCDFHQLYDGENQHDFPEAAR